MWCVRSAPRSGRGGGDRPRRRRQRTGTGACATSWLHWAAAGAGADPGADCIWQLPPRPMSGLWTRRPGAADRARCARPVQSGEAALQAVLELLLARAASPLVVLEPLRGADIGLPSRERDAILGRLVGRRVADMRETAARLAKPPVAGSRAETRMPCCDWSPIWTRSRASGHFRPASVPRSARSAARYPRASAPESRPPCARRSWASWMP